MHRMLVPALLVALALAAGCTKPKGGSAAQQDPARLLKGGTLVFEDDFNRAELGPEWKQSSGNWRIVDGWVHAPTDKNAGLWLAQDLPDKVRIELDARSEDAQGDLKVEVFGETRTHQSGYVLIQGGWKNSLSIIARRDEHGKDRLTSTETLVEQSRTYRWAIARDGDTLHWFVDGKLFMSYPDAKPVRGRVFGFNNWDAKIFFDNVKVYKL